jgi:uncharacterized protein RhaS with RHS repeats
MFYNYQRDYIPGVGRYAQSDPIGLGGGVNTFGYVGGNPTKYTDPLGLNPVGGAYAGAGIGSAFGPVGSLVGGALGFGAGALLGWNVFGPMLSEGAEDPVVYPDNPDNAKPKFRPIKGTDGKQCEDGSVWERDKSGHGNRDGDGDQWKRWKDRKSWENRNPPNSIWPDGRVRK